jgi:hypothetical protein
LAGRDAESCARFLARAVAWYAEHGVAVERALTDNAKAYHARAWIEKTRSLGIERRYTRISARSSVLISESRLGLTEHNGHSRRTKPKPREHKLTPHTCQRRARDRR